MRRPAFVINRCLREPISESSLEDGSYRGRVRGFSDNYFIKQGDEIFILTNEGRIVTQKICHDTVTASPVTLEIREVQ